MTAIALFLEQGVTVETKKMGKQLPAPVAREDNCSF